MGLKLVTAPSAEPVTLAEARTHLRVPSSDTSQDARITAMIVAAREYCEAYTRRRFVTQTWDWLLDAFPAGRVEVPNAPLQSVSSITYVDTAGATQTLATSEYLVDAQTDPGRIEPAYGKTWPVARDQANAVTIRFVCGYGSASSVPEAIKAAILLMLGHLYESREAVMVGLPQPWETPLGVHALLAPYVVARA